MDTFHTCLIFIQKNKNKKQDVLVQQVLFTLILFFFTCDEEIGYLVVGLSLWITELCIDSLLEWWTLTTQRVKDLLINFFPFSR